LQSSTAPSDHWFKRSGKNIVARRRLFCFHHAGGGPSLFREWQNDVPMGTEVVAVALPGREGRIAEKPVTQLRTLVDMLVKVLPVDLPFAFFGHSLGAIVGFELARQLHERSMPLPQHLFISASLAPHLCRRDTSRAQLSDAELLRLLEGFGGTPREVLQHPELRDMVLSILRADFNLIDEYSVPDGYTTRLPITAYAGTMDNNVSLDRIMAWDRWATDDFSLYPFEGGHFYLVRQRRPLIESLFAKWREGA